MRKLFKLSLVPIMMVTLPVLGCATPKKSHEPDVNALGPYSASVTTGNLVFVSGKIGKRGGTFEQEVHSAIEAVDIELAHLDMELKDVACVTVYLTDIDNYDAFNAIYATRFPQPYPARACVAVAALPGGARVEIQAIAVR